METREKGYLKPWVSDSTQQNFESPTANSMHPEGRTATSVSLVGKILNQRGLFKI
jgi:hypothetical protein